MKASKLTKTDLGQFTGTECWYRHAVNRNILYTDGIQYVAEQAGAYWLIDEIAFAQTNRTIRHEEFQVWKLEVNLPQSTAILICEDGNGRIFYRKKIGYTDFPLDEITIYFVDQVILLPSEY